MSRRCVEVAVVVEAQYKVATIALVGGDLAREALLEAILEEAKPRFSESTEGLHWLLATPRALDLSKSPLLEDRAAWIHPSDYSATQQLAETAREAEVEAIRYESVRNPGGYCLALLAPDVFKSLAEPYRNAQQSWVLLINPPHRVVWQRELSGENWLFEFAG